MPVPVTIDDVCRFIELNDNFIRNTYETIHVDSTETVSKFTFDPQYNEMTELNSIIENYNCKNLHRLLSPYNFNVIGSYTTLRDGANVSFISSLIQSMCNFGADKIKSAIHSLIKHAYIVCSDKYKKHYSTMDWELRDLRNTLKNHVVGKDYIKYYSDYVHVNVFVADIDNDEMYHVGTESYNPFRKNVIMIKLNNTFYPVFSEDNQKFFTYSKGIIRKFINSPYEIQLVNCDFTSDVNEFKCVLKRYETMEDYVDNNIDINNDGNNGYYYDNEYDEYEVYVNDYDYYEYDNDIDNDNNSDNISDKLRQYGKSTYNDDIPDITEQLDDTDSEEYEEYEYETITVDKSYKVADLVTIAKDRGIEIYYTDDNGNRKKKKKQMLIDDINNN